MATCPECDAALDLEPEDVDLDDRLSCDDCGTALKVTSIVPLEVDVDEEEEDEDDLEDDEDDDDDDEDVVEDDDAVVEEEE